MTYFVQGKEADGKTYLLGTFDNQHGAEAAAANFAQRGRTGIQVSVFCTCLKSNPIGRLCPRCGGIGQIVLKTIA